MSISPHPDEIAALAGHRFPGGEYTIAHWENFLLTECTGAEPMPDNLAHPVALFHMPILGAGTSIAEMFELGKAESDFSIGIESYDWEIFRPLEEELTYQVSGEIVAAERLHRKGRTFDRLAFRFDLTQPDGTPAARTTVTWHYHRSRATEESSGPQK